MPETRDERSRRIVACDIGGTHARFALASVGPGPRVELSEPITLRTREYPGVAEALDEFARRSGSGPPSNLAIAFAGPVQGEELMLTNSDWVIRPGELGRELGTERLTIVNDFGAVAHAVAAMDEDAFTHLCGPAVPLPAEGVVSVVGPGTGLGAAILLRRSGGSYEVVETEAGHIGFAPLDPVEDRIAVRLRNGFGRVSVERLASGPGLANIVSALAADGQAVSADEAQLWTEALQGKDARVQEALDRLCLVLGSIAGDLALAQGAAAVVIAGGLGRRLADRLPDSGFCGRFVAKGRFEARMREIPVKLIEHPQPGLFGAAAAFAREYC